MRCDRCEDIVSAMLDGEASTIEVEAAEQHLRRCGPCAAHRSAVKALVLPASATRASPPDLSATILARLSRAAGPPA